MKAEKIQTADMYYTNDHEWIEFQGPVAYIGITGFKLTGFKEIQQVIFSELSGFKKRGESIAAVKYNDYQIEAHMPVDGKILQVNTDLLYGDQNLLLQHAESRGWIALIVPTQPDERKDLLPSEQYQQGNKNKNIEKKDD